MFTALEPTKKYFLTMFSVSCALLVVFTCVIYRQSEILQSRSALVLRSYEVLQRSNQVLIHALNMESSQRGFLLSGVPKFLEPYKEKVRTLDDEVDTLAMMLTDEEHATHLALLRKDVAELKAIMDNHIKRAQVARRLTVKDLDESRKRMERLRETLENIAASENMILTTRAQAV
ncbi:MAG: CHASE3 domain-containing protein, partial [Rickettsiales bacterium]|nr:CHASE3 domain-containing protein [Rickettsiales bacterium]